MCPGRRTAATSSLTAAVAATAALAALWLATVQAGSHEGLLRQGNSAWHLTGGPFDNPWISPHPVTAAQTRGKAVDVQTLTNIINVARYILSFPQKCFYRGNAYSCGLGISCWIQGKRPVDLCNGGVIWSCCVPRNAEPSKAGMVKDACKICRNISNSVL